MFFYVTVLSDANKRLMYDIGVYDSDDDENVSHPVHLTLTCSYALPMAMFHFIPIREAALILPPSY